MKQIADQADHPALVKGGLDDRARADFAFSFRNHVTSHLMPANRLVYDRRAKGRFEKAEGRAPGSPAEIRKAMDADDFYRFYLSARRTSQELIWSAVIPPVERGDVPTANAEATPAGGTLTLDPDFEAPRYAAAVDIHCMPGGYAFDRGEGDQAQGAVYDRGVYLYLSGLAGPLNDGVGQLAAHWLKTNEPDFHPRAILEMGCGVGHATLPFVDAYPQAKLTAIDIGAGLLRYAHARAEGLGKPVHFRQLDAERTGFPDGCFDLVYSVIMFHETSTRALPAILKECHRLLRPGGIMMHIDQPSFAGVDDWSTFLQENETYYNNEPFWRHYRRIDLAAAAVDAGFARDAVRLETLAADVIRQSQNNARPADGVKTAAGFSMLLGRKADPHG